MENKLFGNKKGASGKLAVGVLIGIVLILILIANLAPTALTGLFNNTAFVCPGSAINGSGCGADGHAQSGVPAWVSLVLGAIGAIALILYIYRKAIA